MKFGDIVSIKPECCFSDESPEQLYKIVQKNIESYGIHEKIDCQVVSDDRFPPIVKIQMSDLQIAKQ